MKKQALSMIVCASVFSLLATEGPIAQWNMDSVTGGKVTDVTGNGRDLTLGPDCRLSRSGNFDSIYFPGTRGSWTTFSCPALTARTMVFWLNRETSGFGPAYDEDGNAGPLYLCVGVSSMSIQGALNASNPSFEPWYTGTPGACYPQSAAKSPLGRWTQYVVVVETDGTVAANGYMMAKQHLYVDGKLVQTKETGVAYPPEGTVDTVPALLPANLAKAGTAFIGNNGEGSNRPLYGHLGECRLYDRALRADEIHDLYCEKMHGVLRAHWTMESIETDAGGNRFVPGASGTTAKLLVGTSNALVDGIDGKALDFSFTNGEELENTWAYSPDEDPDRGGMSEVTVAFWCNLGRDIAESTSVTTSSGSNNNIPIVWRDPVSGTRAQLNTSSQMGYGSDTCTTFIMNFDGTLQASPQIVVEKGYWSHYAISLKFSPTGKDNRTVTFKTYVNGVLTHEQTAEGSDFVKGTEFLPGAFDLGAASSDYGGTPGNVRVIRGKFDDVRIYEGALTAEEILSIYRSAPQVSAGADLTVASETATLRGALGSVSGRPGYGAGFACDDLTWSLVSAPEGGEDASIAQPKGEVTRVTLPVAGAYTFRLTARTMGVSRADDVTVTRLAAAPTNVPPTVDLAAGATADVQGVLDLAATVADPDGVPGTLRTFWSKVSGAGGVWFGDAQAAVTTARFSAAGEYVLRCTADDGLATASKDIAVTVSGTDYSDVSTLANGLFAHYPLDGWATTSVRDQGGEDGTLANFKGGNCTQHFPLGIDGLCYKNGYTGDRIALTAAAFKEPQQSSRSTPPAYFEDKWRSISMWIKYEKVADPAGELPGQFKKIGGKYVGFPCLASQNDSWDVSYFDYPGCSTPKFCVFQGWGGSNFAAPERPIDNRWVHVYVAIDRCSNRDGEDSSEMWIDGVPLVCTSRPAAGGLINRNNGSGISIASCATTARQELSSWGDFNPGCYAVKEPYGEMTRQFPGLVDEVRFYNRKLTAEEIRYLAAHPVRSGHEGPSVSAPSSPVKAVSREPLTLAVQANGATLAYDNSLTYAWQVVGGDAANVLFSAPTARTTTATFRKSGAYTVQLAVSDGGRTTYSDPIDVTVERAGMVLILR